MKWYYAAALAGLFMPLILFKDSIIIAFKERGIGIGISYWLGFTWFTIPLTILFFWIGKSLVGG